MRYARMPIEIEAPEELGYGNLRNNLSESSVTDRTVGGLGFEIPDLTLLYGEHRGSQRLRELICEGNRALGARDVLITGGAAGALFIVHTAMLAELCDQSRNTPRHRLRYRNDRSHVRRRFPDRS